MADIFDTVAEGDVFDKASNNLKIFDPEMDQQLQGTYEELRSAAIQGGQFGAPSLDARISDILPGGATDQVQKGKERYTQARDNFANVFDLTPDEADDFLKHKFDLQTEPVSRDVFGQVYIKNDVLNKSPDEIKKAISSSNLPDTVKSRYTSEDSPELDLKLADFKVNTVKNVRENHKDLATDLGLTGDTNTDFQKITTALNDTRLEQFGGGAAAGGLRSVRDLAGADVGAGELAFSTSTPQESQAEADRLLQRQQSLNALSNDFNKQKTSIFGTDAAVIGQGAYSAAESVAITSLTGGAASSVVPLRLLPTIGKAVKAAAAVQPVSALYATRQASDTYDEAIKAGKSEDEASDLAKRAFGFEWGFTTAFSAFGAGGLEDIGTAAGREAVKKSLGGVTKDILKTTIGENAEEGLINVFQTALVDAKLHPELTTEDLKKRAIDTALATSLTTGAISGGVAVTQNISNKTTEELEVIADENAKKAVLEDQVEGGPVEKAGAEAVVTGGSQVNENETNGNIPNAPTAVVANTGGQNQPSTPESVSEVPVEETGVVVDDSGSNSSKQTSSSAVTTTRETNEPTPQESNTEEDQPTDTQRGDQQLDAPPGELDTTRTEILTSLGTPRNEGFPDRVVTDKGAVVEVVEEDGVLKASVEVPVESRRQGAATDALTKLKNLADEKQVPITLDVVPLGNNPPLNEEQLTALYEKAGAVNNGDGTLTFVPMLPEPVTQPQENPENTSLRNEALDKDLESFGLPPVAKEFTGTDKENWEQAKARTDEGPKIVNRVLENPAALSSTADAMVLLQETARRKAEVARAIQAVNDGEPNAQADLIFAEQAFDEAARAAKNAGSITGALLRARRFVTTPDFSLETMRSQVRAKVNNGAALSAEQSKQIEDLQKRIAESEEGSAALEAEISELTKALQEAELLKTIKPKNRTNRKAEIKRRIEAANKRMAQRALDPNKSFSGGDPAMVKDTIAIIYSYLELGLVSLDEIRAKMVEKFGEKIAPFVNKHFDESKKLYDELNPVVEEKEPTPKNIRKLANDLVNAGFTGTSVLDEVSRQFGIDRTTARDLFLETAPPTRNALNEEKSRVRRLENLQRQIDRLKAGVVPKAPAAKVEKDAEISRLEKERNALAKSLKISDDSRIIAATQKRTAEINRRIAEKDFSKEVKVPRQKSSQLIKAEIENAKAKEEFDRLLFEAELAKRSKIEKAADTIYESVSFMRTLKTIFDGPPVFRQGGFVTLGRPVLAMRALAKALHAGVSETKAKDLENNIKKAPHYQMALDAGLSLTDHTPGAKLAQQEEEFRGNWAKKIPGLKQVTNFSERGYVALLNDMRMSVFEIMAQSISRTGEITPEEAKVIANHINNSTGRGNLGEWEKSSKAMATLFFSAKYAASRARLILGIVPTLYGATIGPKDKRRARRAIAKDYARFFTGAAAMYALYALAKNGFDDDDEWKDVVTDPRSTDFGKLVIGKNRIDLMAGLLQWTTFMSRMATQETVTAKGDVKDLRNPKSSMDDNTYDVVSRFTRGKLAPAPGAILNVLSGSNVIGQKTTPMAEAAGMVIPMSFSDLYESTRENSPMGAAAISAAVLFGTGYANYDESLSLQQEAAILLGDEEEDFKRKKR